MPGLWWVFAFLNVLDCCTIILLLLYIRISYRLWSSSKKPPSVVIVGSALEPIRISNASQSALDEYKVNLTRLVTPIGRLHSVNTKVLWVQQEPVNEDKLKLEFAMFTNRIIDIYNKAAAEVIFIKFMINFN